MKLINVYKDKFTVVANEIFWDKRLDYRSKGLLATLLALPDGWNFSVRGLEALVTPEDGEKKGERKDTINTWLNKLENFGYLERIQAKDERGKFDGYDYKIIIPCLQKEQNE